MHDTQIEPEAGIAYIERIPLVPAEDLFEINCRPAITLDLCEAGNTGFHQVAKLIRIHYAGEIDTIVIHVRSRSYDAHLTNKNIQELRQFVQIGMTEKTAHPGDSGISFGRRLRIGFRIDAHRPELETGE